MRLKKYTNPTIKIGGILLVKYDGRTVLARRIKETAEMVAGNAEEAWQYLQFVQDDPRAANNMKVYKLLSAGSRPTGVYRYKIATE